MKTMVRMLVVASTLAAVWLATDLASATTTQVPAQTGITDNPGAWTHGYGFDVHWSNATDGLLFPHAMTRSGDVYAAAIAYGRFNGPGTVCHQMFSLSTYGDSYWASANTCTSGTAGATVYSQGGTVYVPFLGSAYSWVSVSGPVRLSSVLVSY